MNTLKLTLIFLLIGLNSCEQNPARQKADTNVAELNQNIIALEAHRDNPDSCKKALSYLDSATMIDNNCFLCHYNKLMFQYPLKQYDKAIATLKECIRIRPFSYDLYLTSGALYEKIGDTVNSRLNFENSLALCNSVLDTIKQKDLDYQTLVAMKAVNLILLGRNDEATSMLNTLAGEQTDPERKRGTLSLIGKDRKELLEEMTP